MTCLCVVQHFSLQTKVKKSNIISMYCKYSLLLAFLVAEIFNFLSIQETLNFEFFARNT